jgi:hypothetical protein
MHLNVFVCTLFCRFQSIPNRKNPNRTGNSMIWFLDIRFDSVWNQKPEPNRSVWFEPRTVPRRMSNIVARDYSKLLESINIFHSIELRISLNNRFSRISSSESSISSRNDEKLWLENSNENESERMRTKMSWKKENAKNSTRLIILYRDDEKIDFSNIKRRLIENFLNNLILMSSSMTITRWKDEN